MRSNEFRARLIGARHGGDALSDPMRHTVRVSHGARTREIELDVNRAELRRAGISEARMADLSLWRRIVEAVEDYLNHSFETLDAIPDQVDGRDDALRNWIIW